MKVMIISDDSTISEELKHKFELKKVEVIVYRWFLKAFDNIEEIQPDYIVVNSNDYPRHWKILPPFIDVNGYNSKLVLYTTSFQITENNHDRKEAEFLQIKYDSSCDSIVDEIVGSESDVTCSEVKEINCDNEAKNSELKEDFTLFTVSNLLVEDCFNLISVDELFPQDDDNQNNDDDSVEINEITDEKITESFEEKTSEFENEASSSENKKRRKIFELTSPADDVALFAVDTIFDDNETFYEDVDLCSVDNLFPCLNEKKLKGSLLRKIIESYETK